MSAWERYLLVALGSALGGCARYGVGGLVARRFGSSFPWGTFVVNVTGSFIIAFFLTLALGRTTLDPRWRLVVAVGFCGGYTTFSSFAWETEQLMESGYLLAVLNAAGSVVAGLIAILLGVAAGRWLA